MAPVVNAYLEIVLLVKQSQTYQNMQSLNWFLREPEKGLSAS